MVVFLTYIFLAFLLASYAGNKGRSFWIWFFVSLFTDPVMAFIILHLTGWVMRAMGKDAQDGLSNMMTTAQRSVDEKVRRHIQDIRNVN